MRVIREGVMDRQPAGVRFVFAARLASNGGVDALQRSHSAAVYDLPCLFRNIYQQTNKQTNKQTHHCDTNRSPESTMSTESTESRTSCPSLLSLRPASAAFSSRCSDTPSTTTTIFG